MENPNLIAVPKRKTRRGLASLNLNTDCLNLENIPPESVFEDEIKDILNAKKQCGINVQNEIEKMQQNQKKQSRFKSRMEQPQTSISTNNEMIDDVELLLEPEPIPKIPVSAEIHGLLKDLEMTKALYLNDQMEVDSEVEICQESLILEQSHNFERESILVRVKYDNNKFHRLTLSMSGQFLIVMEEIGQLLNAPPSRILLSLNDNIVKATDTPSSINLEVTDTIDAYITDDDSPSTFSSHVLAIDEKIEMLNLKIQTSDAKSKLCIQIKKTDRMLILMEKFAQLTTSKIENLKFTFDGEEIQPNDTPENLGLEDGFCIDVGIKS